MFEVRPEAVHTSKATRKQDNSWKAKKEMTQLETYRKALENLNTACELMERFGQIIPEEARRKDIVEEYREARNNAIAALSAQGEQGTDLTPDELEDLRGACEHANYRDGMVSCPDCYMFHLFMKPDVAPTPTAQEPPTEAQERCPKCKTEVEWVVPPIPGVKPFFQCQDPDCNWMSDDDFPVTESKEGRGE